MRSGFHLPFSDWSEYDLHRAERTSNDARFTANTLFRVHLNAVVIMADCPVRATSGAGRIFTVMAGYRTALLLMLDDGNSGLEMPLTQDMLLAIVSHDAGDLTGMASQALLAINHNKTIHGFLLFWLQKPYSLYECCY